MTLSQRVFSRRSAGYDCLRLTLCVLLSVHGWYRFYEGTLPVLGQILESHGFVQGYLLACLVNLAETGGTVLLALRILATPIALILAGIYATGIFLFHWQRGFFVVGPGDSGWEYSALLIVCLLITAGVNANTAVWRRAPLSEAD
jgi:putative oxidoreductase